MNGSGLKTGKATTWHGRRKIQEVDSGIIPKNVGATVRIPSESEC